jgi:putative transport protein
MTYSPFDTLRQYPELAVYLVLALGFGLGKVKIKAFSLGVVTCTLIAGLLIGQADIHISSVLSSTFFMMFLFAVGYGVGPEFFRALRSDGLPQVAFSTLICCSGLACAYVLARILGYDAGLAAGLLSGGYTNSTVLGVASDAITRTTSDQVAAAKMLSLMSVAYAVTYPFGTAGAAWFLATLGPKLLKVDLPSACKEYEQQMAGGSLRSDGPSAYREISARAYRLTNPALQGLTVAQFEDHFSQDQLFVRRLEHDGKVQDCESNTILPAEGVLVIAAHLGTLVGLEEHVGPEIDDGKALDFPTEQLDVVITRRQAQPQTVGELLKANRDHHGRGVFLCRLSREGIEVPLFPTSRIAHGDVLTLQGAKQDVAIAANHLGYPDRPVVMSDMLIMCTAVVVGGLLGAITIHVGGIPLSFGSSVGVLIAGLTCGYLHGRFRTFGRIPASALWVFNNVGLNGFIAVVGINAGPGLISGLRDYGVTLVLCGVVVSLLPLLLGIYLGKYVFRFHPGITLGACAGARTTTAALGALESASQSKVPALGYTVSYAVARILLAIWGMVIVMVFH